MKYLKIMIIIVIISIVGLGIYIIYNTSMTIDNTHNNININMQNTTNIKNNDVANNIVNNTINNEKIRDEEKQNLGDKVVINGEVKEVTSANMFYIVEKCVQNYINNVTSRNTNAIYSQLSPKYISNNGIDVVNVLNYVESISENQEFRAIKMNYVQGNVIDQYSIYGKLLSSTGNTSEIYLILNLNSGNLRYSIIPQLGRNYTNLSQVTIGITDEVIVENNYNQGSYVRITDEQLIKNIMKDYQKNALYDTQNAYKSLDAEYSKARFKDYSDYFNYVRNNVSKIKDLTLVQYSKNDKTGYVQYVCKDNYGNVYTVNATGIMEYTIILDDYTLYSESEYTSLTNEQKIKYNVNKIIKMVNTCDYVNLYQVLNDNFKSNYFKTQSEFETYLKQNLFEYNIVSLIEITEREDGIYVCSVELKDRSTVAANTITKTIIMKLGTGTSFEMSFEV